MYLRQEHDFIERTKKILFQYRNNFSNDEKYEVTLLMNCLLGLIILPQQHWYEQLPEEEIEYEKWGIKRNHVIYIKEDETINIKNILRHLRNSISHYRFKAFSNSDKKIEYIYFYDEIHGNKTFEINLDVVTLREFAIYLSEKLTKDMINTT
jgi:hypothetical protein